MNTTFPDLQDRYFRDTQFKQLVDAMHNMLVTQKIPAYELRDAAYMASIKFAQLNIEPQFVMDTFSDAKRDEILSLLRSMNVV